MPQSIALRAFLARKRPPNIRITKLLLAMLAVVVGAGLAGSSSAQFAYLDANDDGTNTIEDVLQPIGQPTLIKIYLDTGHNADGSDAQCTDSTSELSINSYEVVLRASGGTVAFSDFINAQPSMPIPFGAASNSTEFYSGFGGGTILDTGLYLLGSVQVTAVEGSPSLEFGVQTQLGGTYGTTFGTACAGSALDNTYRLGTDWYETSGCGAPDGANAMPSSSLGSRVVLDAATFGSYRADFNDFDGDSVSATFENVPGNVAIVEGVQSDRRKQVRFYSTTGSQRSRAESTTITVRVSDGHGESTRALDLVVLNSKSEPSEAGKRISEIVLSTYTHGIPRHQVLAVGRSALPRLCELLRDSRYRGYWPQVINAIGWLGDAAYFDTLKAFVWDRFRGEVSPAVYLAAWCAQANLGAMATVSPPARRYVLDSCEPAFWAALPWRTRTDTQEYCSEQMFSASLSSAAFTDGPEVADKLRDLAVRLTSERLRKRAIDAALRNEKVRASGLIDAWGDARTNYEPR